MAATVVKCLYEFVGEAETDLSLSLGDLIKITNVVSDDWYEGTCNGKSGQFPKAFVEAVKSSEIFEMALAVANFSSEQEGDISLKEGEVVIITEIIDDNWAIGHTHGGNKGSFPRAFIKQISFEDSALKNALQASVEPKDKMVGLTNTDNETVEDGPPSSNTYAVISPFVAQGENELNIVVGDIVEVLSTYDDFWLEGKLQSGKTGIFPKMCIDYREEINEKLAVANSDQVISKVEVESVIERTEEPKSDPEKCMLSAIFVYNSSVEGDLSFEIGAKIKLVEVIDENWYRGEMNGIVGVFPANHVEKISNASLNANEKIQENDLPSPDVDKFEKFNSGSIPATPLNTILQDSEEEIKKKDLKVSPSPPISKTVRKTAPTRPVTGPKKPSPINNKVVESTVLEKVEKPEKPKKKALPERPKMPSKRDILPPFSYTFSTESQPTVIIPGQYVKPGEPNVIILRQSAIKST